MADELNPSENTASGDGSSDWSGYSDDDFKRSIWRALRLVGIAIALGVPLLGWKLGWATAGLFAVGAAISGSGLLEWLRLLTAVMTRMDARTNRSAPARPLAPVLIGFFLRLGIAGVLIYVSLRSLHGSVYAMIAGLALGVVALSIEGIRLLKSWTM
jgi:hypothetical protein